MPYDRWCHRSGLEESAGVLLHCQAHQNLHVLKFCSDKIRSKSSWADICIKVEKCFNDSDTEPVPISRLLVMTTWCHAVQYITVSSRYWRWNTSGVKWLMDLVLASIADCVECLSILIICYHVWLYVKPASLLKFLRCNSISTASLTKCSIQVAVLFNLWVISNWNSCLVFICSARADFSDSPCHKCLLGFWHLILIILDVWPPYTSPHSHGMQYMPDILRPRSSLISLKVLVIFFTKMWIVVILCLATSLLV